MPQHPYRPNSLGAAHVTSSRLKVPQADRSQEKPSHEQLALLQTFLDDAGLLGNTDLIEIIKAELLVDRREARQVFRQVVIFLWLSTIKPEDSMVVPSRTIDRAWKQFILQTAMYRAFQSRLDLTLDRIERTSTTAQWFARHEPWMCLPEEVRAFLGDQCTARWWYKDAHA